MRILIANICLALLATALSVTPGHAQAQDGDSTTLAAQPVQLPVVTAPYSGNSKSPNADSATSVSDKRPLAGAQDLSPDSTVLRRSYWQPFFNLTSTLDTNPLGAGNTVSLVPWGSFYGGAELLLSSRRSDLTLNYLGGGVVSQHKNEDQPIQQLAVGEKLSWRHAAISLFDQVAYFPEAVSGFHLPTGSSLTSNRELALQPVFVPNQSIVTTVGQELTNAFIGELDLSPTARSSLTFLESYSVVRFFNSGFLNLNDTVLQGGFNHQITRNNTIALLYRYTGFRFSNLYQPLDGHVVQLAFGRQVTGRLAFQLSAGPKLSFFRTAAQQSLGSTLPTIVVFKRLSWTLDSSMTYDIRRTVLRLGYNHDVTDGAGFLAGTTTDRGYASIDSQLSSALAGELIGGYASNRSLIATAKQPVNALYRDWLVGVTISHIWGRRASIFLSYQVQRQASNFACAGVGCGNSFARQFISLGLTGRAQPRPIG
jgi:hypothetical protein